MLYIAFFADVKLTGLWIRDRIDYSSLYGKIGGRSENSFI